MLPTAMFGISYLEIGSLPFMSVYSLIALLVSPITENEPSNELVPMAD